MQDTLASRPPAALLDAGTRLREGRPVAAVEDKNDDNHVV
jgi:hypothetical protein